MTASERIREARSAQTAETRELPDGYVVAGVGIMDYTFGWPINGTVQLSGRRYSSRGDAVAAAFAHHKRITLIRERAARGRRYGR